MKIEPLPDVSSSGQAAALGAFEAEFRYPLGAGRWFRIEHGQDYGRFFASIGESRTWIAESLAQIVGAISAARVTLRAPCGESQSAAYFGDFKVRLANPRQSAGWVAAGLLRRAADWAQSYTRRGLAIVMDGTAVAPEKYTGRLGLPPFTRIGHVTIWRMEPPPARNIRQECTRIAAGELGDHFRRLTAGSYILEHPLTQPSLSHGVASRRPERSVMRPRCWLHASESACGLLEDTRLAKRLYVDDGAEMVSGHLSCLAFQDPRAAVDLIQMALSACAPHGIRALFMALPDHRADELSSSPAWKEWTAGWPQGAVLSTGAAIWGTGLESGFDWYLHTAEI